MHTSGTHRAHVIAGPAPEHEPLHSGTPQMRRMAALFNAHRDAVLQDGEAIDAQEPVLASEPAQTHDPESASDSPSSAHGELDLPMPPLTLAEGEQKQNGGSQQDANGGDGNGGNSDSDGGRHPQPNGLVAKPAGTGSIAALASALFRASNASCAAAASTASTSATNNTASPSPQFTPTAALPIPGEIPTTPPQPAHARVEATTGTYALGALNNAQQANPLVDSIVSSVADFCANPAVHSCNPWHITLPLDPEVLPDCQLSLMLSHFDLTLRFITAAPASQQLVLQHADALRERLEALPGLHEENRRKIDIIVA
ncbi:MULTISPECIES: type III secretion system protein SctP [Paraburkholderia]|uniref:type III secretion system protein SctP n=1 Tax=Paraburkholderia TaxID=1822464 RepID=UPI00225A9C93|nr:MULTISPECIES: type III secretion system protein SctP [Paraburkholderia]MCX4161418.1 type III secretion system protein SctP [Paraburkholderia megapolitana]MDN7156914.1 type III secretion system protein SctP [Paraburkholderia sp. CHISQ3]MDQ6493959.1 type III secretion system protein SctP [Paraburkholderia megapolitana]